MIYIGTFSDEPERPTIRRPNVPKTPEKKSIIRIPFVVISVSAIAVCVHLGGDIETES
jgi:hypothetical protein